MPQVKGTLASSGTIAWSGAPAGRVYAVSFLPYTASDAGLLVNNVVLSVYTSGSSIDMTLLAALGVEPAPQTLVLFMSAQGAVPSLNAMVDQQTLATPDGSAGSMVSLPFKMTP